MATAFRSPRPLVATSLVLTVLIAAFLANESCHNLEASNNATNSVTVTYRLASNSDVQKAFVRHKSASGAVSAWRDVPVINSVAQFLWPLERSGGGMLSFRIEGHVPYVLTVPDRTISGQVNLSVGFRQGAGIRGIAWDTNKKTIANVQVRLVTIGVGKRTSEDSVMHQNRFPEAYDWETRTDAAGRFEFSGVNFGTYDLELFGVNGTTGALIMDLYVNRNSDLIDVGPVALRKFVNVTIKLDGRDKEVESLDLSLNRRVRGIERAVPGSKTANREFVFQDVLPGPQVFVLWMNRDPEMRVIEVAEDQGEYIYQWR